MTVTSKHFLKACSLSIALIGSTAVVAAFTVPDYAYAKNSNGGGNGNGKGGGNSGGGNGNGGGNGKSDGGGKSNGSGNGNSDGGSNGKSGGQGSKQGANKNDSTKGSGKGSGKARGGAGQKGTKSKESEGKNFSLKDVFGGQKKKASAKSAKPARAFQRSVTSIFGGKTQQPTRQKASVRHQESSQIESSPRPVARRDIAIQLPEFKKNPSRRYRDPLVAAITDPDGSNKLKNLNAAAQAFQNASPNSNVGKIATYQEAAVDYYALRDGLTDARRELNELNKSYDGRPSEEIVDDIEALDPADPDYDADRQALADELGEASEFEDARAELADDLKDLRGDTRTALESAESAFFEASKGRTLTRDALGEFHENIGLPEPTTPHEDRPEVTPYDQVVALVSGTVIDEATDYKKNPSRRYRDPLVAAITDPDGSNKLKNLNASNAAAQAFQNASPNSNVGKIATYREAAVDYYALRDDLTDARRELNELNESYDGRPSEDIVDDIEALDPADPDYDADRQALADELGEASEFEDAQAELADDVRDVRRETLFASKEAEGAFYQASKGAVLTSKALTEFHTKLGLPVPIQ